MSTFQYEKLVANSEFRIAILQPGGLDDTIEISLRHADFDDNVNYQALSYVWGDKSITRRISLHGQQFDIRINLFLALRRLRHKDAPRLLWIDSICINQKNDLERQQQISRMRDIYSRASKVIIWTGDDDTLAISATHLAGLIFYLARNNPEILDESNSRISRTIAARNAITSHEWFRQYAEPAQKFLGNEWFRRVWTFQEAYLGRDIEVVCGKTSFPWMPFVHCWGLLDSLGIKLPLKGMESAMTIFATCAWAEENGTAPESNHHSRLRLSNLLRSTYTHLATDPRDKIYGLLAMIQSRAGVDFQKEVDYTASVEKVYTCYSRLMIQDDGHLQILSDTQNKDRRPLLPSWVPDWEKGNKINPLAERIRSFQQRYNLNKGLDQLQIITSNSDDQKLHLRGVRIGSIQKICVLNDLMHAINPLRIELANWQSTLSHFKQKFYLQRLASASTLDDNDRSKAEGEASNARQIMDLSSNYIHTGESMFSAFVKTLAADFLPISERVGEDLEHYFPAYYTYRSMTWMDVFLPLITSEEIMGNSPYAGIRGAPVQEVLDLLFDQGQPTQWALEIYDIRILKVASIYKEIVVEICKSIHQKAGRCLYITENGYLGLGPIEARVGDGVYDLLGGDVPFVLRETENSEEFTLLGDSYVHGIMDGELWEPSQDENGLGSVEGNLEWADVVLV